MFRKRKEPVRDNTDSQVTMEQIRRRMVSNVTRSEPSTQAETEVALDTIASEYPKLTTGAPSYATALQNLAEAREIGVIIREVNRETPPGKGGRNRIGGMLRNSMRWYTAPAEDYWSGVLGSMDRILAALKAHDAVVKIHADALCNVQSQTARLTQQLGEISDPAMPDKEKSK